MISYYDFKEYQDYLKEPPPVSWLPEFDKYVSEKYGVKLMPTYYKENPVREHCFHAFKIVPFSDEDFHKLDDFFKGRHVHDHSVFENGIGEIIGEFMNRYNSPKTRENSVIFPCLEHSYLWHYRFNYLYNELWEMRDELKKHFDYLKPYKSVSFGRVCVCILETRKQAAEFYRSPEYEIIRKKLYEAVKEKDEYDVFLPEYIHIFVDYSKHYHSIPMYERWVWDMFYEEMKNYMDSL